MTHPDTLQISRAVVEQALEAMEPFAGNASGIHKDWADERRRASLTQDKPLTVAHFRVLLKASEALRAALQPQAADDKIKALAAKAPKDVRIYPGGGEVIPQAASDCRTCQHLSEAWGVCEARPKCVGGEQYVYFPEKQLWDKTPRNDGQAAHQEMREALYAEFNRAVGRQHD